MWPTLDEYCNMSDVYGEGIQGYVQFLTVQYYLKRLSAWSLLTVCGGDGRTSSWDLYLNCMKHNVSQQLCTFFKLTVGTSSFLVWIHGLLIAAKTFNNIFTSVDFIVNIHYDTISLTSVEL